MNNGEIYTQYFNSDKKLSAEELKAIFTSQLGAIYDIDDTNPQKIKVYNSKDKKVGFEITVSVNDYGGAATVVPFSMAGRGVGNSYTATSTAGIFFRYARSNSGNFIFGFKNGDDTTVCGLQSVLCTATKFDGTAVENVAVQMQTGNNRYMEIADEYICQPSRIMRILADNTFVQLSNLVCGSDKFVCDKLFVSTYGGNTAGGTYAIENYNYISADARASSGYFDAAPCFLRCE